MVPAPSGAPEVPDDIGDPRMSLTLATPAAPDPRRDLVRTQQLAGGQLGNCFMNPMIARVICSCAS